MTRVSTATAPCVERVEDEDDGDPKSSFRYKVGVPTDFDLESSDDPCVGAFTGSGAESFSSRRIRFFAGLSSPIGVPGLRGRFGGVVLNGFDTTLGSGCTTLARGNSCRGPGRRAV